MPSDLLTALRRPLDVLVTFDWETYYDRDYSLRKLTTEAYVRDPRFEVIGVGVKFGERPSVWLEEPDFREWAARVDWSRIALAAHHAHFEGLVLSHHYGKRPGFWIDTLSMGRIHHGTEVGGSLAKLSAQYGVGVKGDEVVKAIGKRRRHFTPEEWERYGAYCRNDVDLTRALIPKLSAGLPLEELWLIDTTVRMFTEPTLVLNQAVLGAALEQERAKKREILERLGATREVLSSNDQFADLLRKVGIDPPRKAGKKSEIYAFAKTDPGMQALIDHDRDEVRALAEGRLAIKSTLIETRTERFIGMGRRGPAPVYLKHAGAHTHRWSGGDKANWQNMNRGGDLRAAVEAPEGYKLVVADSGQIEARVVAWLARQTDLLETFRRNDLQTAEHERTGQGEPGDFYSDVGGQFFGKKLSKKDTPVERQVSKNMVLGLGFGMGWRKFSGELLKGMLGAPPVQFTQADATRYGVDVRAFELRPADMKKKTCGEYVEEMRRQGVRIEYGPLLVHCAVADHFVRLYRTRNARIAGLWDALRDMLARMEPDQGPEIRGRFGPLTFRRHAMVKPTGLVLHYPGLHRSKSGDYSYLGGKGGRERVRIYGGLLTENAVQSLARDVVAEQALHVRARGYRIATTTHDEIVAVVREDQADRALQEMLEVMRTPPSWCSDLPLNASGAVAKSYGDCK